ncbi:triphosphoribosyl-dephospho-CoA synthase CitG [Globicatella sp. PHS-GS-PNBC-21-1553]|uniref:triphosphoribosyl-dephospho-CoA synthase CitG n=1 Tax=Globicatella sp. PHS-GS-PNBC-21-1553 TaxID=2885764 RepID=UPI00298EFF53|nr:triphosphoribosyl-dephospho-CoA synthase CitG [Globicatella sp. PHS-GS-PNBC-21-1553]WPC08552.1 triphosphoribosyl-dephospho-CoA synthase CitG [Globicatella sp. PHS-GS-PNBC-21-1553]
MSNICEWITSNAEKALLVEVMLTPKPGLVDCMNSGAHSDMNYFTFVESTKALTPFFKQYLQLGMEHQGNLQQLFMNARQMGVKAEQAMLKATKGVNTHKGANYSYATILTALGYYLTQHPEKTTFSAQDTEAILSLSEPMTYDFWQSELAQLKNKTESITNGERIYLDYGLTGIKGESMNGYPLLREMVLPFTRELLNYTDNLQYVLSKALLLLISQAEDTNIIHRGNYEIWQNVKAKAGSILKELNEDNFQYLISQWDQELIEQNLSPGGAADLLSIVVFFLYLEKIL